MNSDEDFACKFATSMQRVRDDPKYSAGRDHLEQMAFRSLIIDHFKVLKEMVTTIVRGSSQPHLVQQSDYLQSNDQIERAQFEISTILKNLNDYPT